MQTLPRAHIGEVAVHTRLDHTEIHALDKIRGKHSRAAVLRMLVREALQHRLDRDRT